MNLNFQVQCIGKLSLSNPIFFPGNSAMTAQKICCLNLCGRHLVLSDGYRDMNQFAWNHPVNVSEVI